MYEVTGEKELVRCEECLLISQTLSPAPISAVHTDARHSPISSQGWPEDGISTTESVTSMNDRKVGTEEFKTALDAFLLCFGQSMNIQKLLGKASKKKLIISMEFSMEGYPPPAPLP